MPELSLLTNQARALLLIADNPEARLRDIASALNVTERTAFALVTELTDAGIVVKEKDGRRNRYLIQTHVRLMDPIGAAPTIGEVLDLLVEPKANRSAKPDS